MSSAVTIFSREGASSYEWLIQLLLTLGAAQNVSPFYISNNNNDKFRDEVTRCTFAILYHSKRRGRINIVDVKDSLYDNELKYLSEQLGRNNVIVVIDDLDDSSYEEKNRILGSQPSIKELTCELFLFSVAEKASLQHKQKENYLPTVKDKINQLGKIVGNKVYEDNQIHSNYRHNYYYIHGSLSVV
ncbi:uncharacterized protein LOC128641811 isoform X2 [Bombina bombina]|uniref:uncharacterized protein LOC128641811 isoform X2 n=1 Tax=Bombina bombina TaxID=8345 RepID=UPI00235A47ED|nr:uncharacterized protein LOC128641811 isoform X2 [Bombina bombina]